ncbi:3-hydroxyacyl-CoA dehydrogenase family protein (plasmid) [Haloferacaceae archaeon DSL9]
MRVAVLGAGSMGHGIAQVAAMAGHEVVLRDLDEDLVETGLENVRDVLREGVDRGKVTGAEMDATIARLSGTTTLETAVEDADLVVEAVPESLDLKREVFSDVEAAAPTDCVIASNTSSLPLSELASVLDDPTRAVGLHFFNPPHIMPLVEIVLAEQTSSETEAFAVDFVESADKTPIVVRDSAGFASSRLGLVLGLEAVRMVETGVADPEAIDAAMREGYGHPMGPLELTDHVGLDVRLDIADHLREELGERFRPPQLLRRKVRAGKLGKKTGEGFYRWRDGETVTPADASDAEAGSDR